MTTLSRRDLLRAGFGLAGAGALAACTSPPPARTPAKTFGTANPVAPTGAQRVVSASLTPKPVTLDLGGPTASTWAYGDTAPGPLLRATAGDLLRVTVDNQLPADTTVHWHGIRLRNDADGVPGVTQDPIRPGARYTYEFTAPDPGTYFFHPHVGVQLDRGLYAPLLIDDPAEPGAYDAEWVVVLDDWVDGTGRTPDDVLAQLVADGGPTTGGIAAMGHGAMMDDGGMGAAPFGNAGDVTYPHYLVNGRIPAAPTTFTAKPGQRVRLRLINAAADSIFTVALGGHRLTVTHADGYAVMPRVADAVYVGMGERYDLTTTLADGVFPLVAVPFGKQGQAMAVVRTGSGDGPPAGIRPRELTGSVLLGADLRPTDATRLPARTPDATTTLALAGAMKPYLWAINGAPYGQNDPVTVSAGQRLRLTVSNTTMMTHPIHLHGHTFALANSGLRKDTLLVRPMESVPIDVQADNVGDWMIHCHNVYHAEAGMMIVLSYLT